MHDGGTIVVRRLNRPHKAIDEEIQALRAGTFVDESWLAQCDSLYKNIAPRGANWKSLSKTDHQDNFVSDVLAHTLIYARRMPPSVMLEIKRYFEELCNDSGEYIEGKEVRKVLSRLHDPGTAKKLSEKVCAHASSEMNVLFACRVS